MSVWASCPTEPLPVIYDCGYADEIPDDGWFDVAVSCISDRVRVLVESEGERGGIGLDVDGVRSLMQSLQNALNIIEARKDRR